jgi:hypothetical protein
MQALQGEFTDEVINAFGRTGLSFISRDDGLSSQPRQSATDRTSDVVV